MWQDVLSPFSDNSDIKEADWQARETRGSGASDDKDTDPVSRSICWVVSHKGPLI